MACDRMAHDRPSQTSVGGDVGLAVAVVDYAALQDLEVVVDLMRIPAQAVEQVIKSEEASVLIGHPQGRQSRPHGGDLVFFHSRVNLIAKRGVTCHWCWLVSVPLLTVRFGFGDMNVKPSRQVWALVPGCEKSASDLKTRGRAQGGGFTSTCVTPDEVCLQGSGWTENP